MDNQWLDDNLDSTPRFDGSGKLYLIERSLKRDGYRFWREITDELLQDYVLKDFKENETPKDVKSAVNLEDEQLFLVASIRDAPVYDGSLLPFPMPQHVFERITKHLRVPSTFLHVVRRCTALQIRETPIIPSNEASSDDYISFIIHSNINKILCFVASFSYHIKLRRMYAFIHGLRTHPMDLFIQRIYDPSPIPLNTFWSIPSMLLEIYLQRTLALLNECHDNIFRLEKTTGVRWDSDKSADLEDIDFIRLTRDLNFTNTNLVYQTWAYKTYRPMLDFLDNIVKQYHTQAVSDGESKEHAAHIERAVLEKQEYLRCWLDGMERRVEYLSQRGEALGQTIYNMIAQKDNSLSRRMTQTSLDLTKASKKLAKDSQEVTIAASRDGAVMRTIAAVTIFFLPATFTATFFSTSFFDFRAGPHERVYSWWIWLYFLVTIILTGVVIGGWFVQSRTKEKEILTKFGANQDMSE